MSVSSDPYLIGPSDLEKLEVNHGKIAHTQPMLMKLTTYCKQLLMNEYELNYWHAINLNRSQIWTDKPETAIEKLLV
jgi:hypothetical protein